MKNKNVRLMNKNEIKEYIFKLQGFIKTEQENGKDIDTILDETDVFDQFEEILPDNEYPIFVIMHGYGSHMDDLVPLAEVIDKDKYLYVFPVLSPVGT